MYERGGQEAAMRGVGLGEGNGAWEEICSDAAWVELNGGEGRRRTGWLCHKANLGRSRCYDGDWVRDLAYSSS